MTFDQSNTLKRKAALGAAFLYFLLVCTPALAAESFEELMAGADAAYSKGKYVDAINGYRKALAEAEKSGDKQNIGLVLSDISYVSVLVGTYSEGVTAAERGIAISKETKDEKRQATFLVNLANLVGAQGDLNSALNYAKEAVEIRERILKPNDASLAQAYNDLAGNYMHLRKVTEAETNYKRALKIYEDNGDPRAAACYSNLSLVCVEQGKGDEAEQLAQKALAIDEKNKGPDHPWVAADAAALATIYFAQGKYTQVEPLIKRALAIEEKAAGPQSEGLAEMLDIYSQTLAKLGRQNESKECAVRANSIRTNLQH
jgi:tetratricopeptide (TPR) repeat protein